MKFEDFVDFLTWIDSLSQKDFDTARSLLLLRAMHRELYHVHTPTKKWRKGKHDTRILPKTQTTNP